MQKGKKRGQNRGEEKKLGGRREELFQLGMRNEKLGIGDGDKFEIWGEW